MDIKEPTLTLYRDYFKQRGIPDAAVEFMIAAQRVRSSKLLRIALDMLFIVLGTLLIIAFLYFETHYIKDWVLSQTVWKESLFYDVNGVTNKDFWLFLHQIFVTLAVMTAMVNLKYLLPFSKVQKARWVAAEGFRCDEQAMIMLYKRGEKWDFRQFRKAVESLREGMNHFSVETVLYRLGKKRAYRGFVMGGISLLIALMVAYYDVNGYRRLTENGLEVKSAFSDSPVHFAWKDVTEVEVTCVGFPRYIIRFPERQEYHVLMSVSSPEWEKNLATLHQILQKKGVKFTSKGFTPGCDKELERKGMSLSPEIKKIFSDDLECESTEKKQE